MTSDLKREVAIWSNLSMRSETSPNRRKAALNVETFDVIQEINASESIFSDRFTAGNRINALTAHAQTLLLCLKQMALDRLRVRLNVILFYLLCLFANCTSNVRFISSVSVHLVRAYIRVIFH